MHGWRPGSFACEAQGFTPPRRIFCARTIGRSSGNTFPELDSRFKAASMKPIVFWLAGKTLEVATKGEGATV